MLSWKVWCKCNILLWKWYLSHYLFLMEGGSNGGEALMPPDQGSLKAGWGSGGTVGALTALWGCFLPVSPEGRRRVLLLPLPLSLRQSALFLPDGRSAESRTCGGPDMDILLDCVADWIPSPTHPPPHTPQFICWNVNSQDLIMWLYLEIGLWVIKLKWDCWDGPSSNVIDVFTRRRNWDSETPRTLTHRQKTT